MKYLFLCLLLIGSLSCRTTQQPTFNYFDLKKAEDVVFTGAKNPFSLNFMKFTKQDSFLVATNYINKNYFIQRYDWKTKKLVSSEPFSSQAPPIDDVAHHRYIDSWCYVAPDSFFWSYAVGWHPRFEASDSTLMRMNARGEPLETIDLSIIPRQRTTMKLSLDPTQHKAERKISKDSAVWISMDDSRLMVNNGKIFLTFDQGHSRPGWKNFCKIPYEVGGHIEYRNGKHVFTPHPVYFPEFARKHHYPSDFTSPQRVINHRGNPVYGFWMTPTYTEYDLKTGKTKSYHVPHSLIDTILPASSDSNGKLIGPDEQWNKKGGEYFYLYFDPYRKQYLRFLKLPAPPKPTIEELSIRRYVLAVMDTNFKLLGEALLPEEIQPSPDPDKIVSIWPHLIIAPEGVYFINVKESYLREGEASVYTRYDFMPTKKKPIPFPNRKKGITQDSWLPYFRKEHQHSPQNEAIIFVPLDNSCPPCKDDVLAFYKKFRQQYPDKPIRLVAALKRRDQKVIDRHLNDSSLVRGDARTFYDAQGRYLKYVLDFINPRIILVQDGKIIKDLTLNPSQIPDLPPIVYKFFDVTEPKEQE